MKVLKNFAKSSVSKEPRLKCRYSQGLGDLIACVLHSRYIGWLTHKITGMEVPCEMCSKRADALNTLFPIPFWKLFFKSEEKLKESLIEDLKNAQFEVQVNKEGYVFATKVTENSLEQVIEPSSNEIGNEPPKKEDYILTGSNDNYIGEFLIQTLIYKHK